MAVFSAELLYFTQSGRTANSSASRSEPSLHFLLDETQGAFIGPATQRQSRRQGRQRATSLDTTLRATAESASPTPSVGSPSIDSQNNLSQTSSEPFLSFVDEDITTTDLPVAAAVGTSDPRDQQLDIIVGSDTSGLPATAVGKDNQGGQQQDITDSDFSLLSTATSPPSATGGQLGSPLDLTVLTDPYSYRDSYQLTYHSRGNSPKSSNSSASPPTTGSAVEDFLAHSSVTTTVSPRSVPSTFGNPLSQNLSPARIPGTNTGVSSAKTFLVTPQQSPDILKARAHSTNLPLHSTPISLSLDAPALTGNLFVTPLPHPELSAVLSSPPFLSTPSLHATPFCARSPGDIYAANSAPDVHITPTDYTSNTLSASVEEGKVKEGKVKEEFYTTQGLSQTKGEKSGKVAGTGPQFVMEPGSSTEKAGIRCVKNREIGKNFLSILGSTLFRALQMSTVVRGTR